MTTTFTFCVCLHYKLSRRHLVEIYRIYRNVCKINPVTNFKSLLGFLLELHNRTKEKSLYFVVIIKVLKHRQILSNFSKKKSGHKLTHYLMMSFTGIFICFIFNVFFYFLFRNRFARQGMFFFHLLKFGSVQNKTPFLYSADIICDRSFFVQ